MAPPSVPPSHLMVNFTPIVSVTFLYFSILVDVCHGVEIVRVKPHGHPMAPLDVDEDHPQVGGDQITAKDMKSEDHQPQEKNLAMVRTNPASNAAPQKKGASKDAVDGDPKNNDEATNDLSKNEALNDDDVPKKDDEGNATNEAKKEEDEEDPKEMKAVSNNNSENATNNDSKDGQNDKETLEELNKCGEDTLGGVKKLFEQMKYTVFMKYKKSICKVVALNSLHSAGYGNEQDLKHFQEHNMKALNDKYKEELIAIQKKIVKKVDVLQKIYFKFIDSAWIESSKALPSPGDWTAMCAEPDKPAPPGPLDGKEEKDGGGASTSFSFNAAALAAALCLMTHNALG